MQNFASLDRTCSEITPTHRVQQIHAHIWFAWAKSIRSPIWGSLNWWGFFEGEWETETKALFFCIAFSHLFLNSLEIMQKGWDGSRTCYLSKEWNSASPSHEPSYEGAWREGESQRGLRPGCGSQPPATSHHSRQKLHFVENWQHLGHRNFIPFLPHHPFVSFSSTFSHSTPIFS